MQSMIDTRNPFSFNARNRSSTPANVQNNSVSWKRNLTFYAERFCVQADGRSIKGPLTYTRIHMIISLYTFVLDKCAFFAAIIAMLCVITWVSAGGRQFMPPTSVIQSILFREISWNDLTLSPRVSRVQEGGSVCHPHPWYNPSCFVKFCETIWLFLLTCRVCRRAAVYATTSVIQSILFREISWNYLTLSPRVLRVQMGDSLCHPHPWYNPSCCVKLFYLFPSRVACADGRQFMVDAGTGLANVPDKYRQVCPLLFGRCLGCQASMFSGGQRLLVNITGMDVRPVCVTQLLTDCSDCSDRL